MGQAVNYHIVIALLAEIEWFNFDPGRFKADRISIDGQLEVELFEQFFVTDGPANVRTE